MMVWARRARAHSRMGAELYACRPQDAWPVAAQQQTLPRRSAWASASRTAAPEGWSQPACARTRPPYRLAGAIGPDDERQRLVEFNPELVVRAEAADALDQDLWAVHIHRRACLLTRACPHISANESRKSRSWRVSCGAPAGPSGGHRMQLTLSTVHILAAGHLGSSRGCSPRPARKAGFPPREIDLGLRVRLSTSARLQVGALTSDAVQRLRGAVSEEGLPWCNNSRHRALFCASTQPARPAPLCMLCSLSGGTHTTPPSLDPSPGPAHAATTCNQHAAAQETTTFVASSGRWRSTHALGALLAFASYSA